MKPEVNVKIPAPSSATWNVPNTSFSSLNVIHPGEQASGWYNSDIAASYKGQNNVITTVNLTLSSKITMPVWQGYSSAKQVQKNEWDKFYNALARHESKHHSIATDGVNRLAAELRLANDLGEGQINSMVQGAIKRINAEQKEYDRKTQHGATEGVYLDTSVGSGTGGGGGGGGCFEGSTLVLMSDGTTRKISEIVAGEFLRVCSVDGLSTFDAELLSMEVDPHRSYNTIVFSDGSEIVASRRQPILTEFGAIRSMYLLRGAKVLGRTDTKDVAPKVIGGIEVKEVLPVYEPLDLFCPDFYGDFCIFAGPNKVAFPGTVGGPIKN